MAVFQAVCGDSVRHLTNLLAPLDRQPEKLAAQLLYRFGSIAAIVNASAPELKQASEGNEAWLIAFLAIRQLLNDGLREELVRTSLDANSVELKRYLLSAMGHLREERMIAIFADRAGEVIAEEVIAEGEESYLLINSRRILGRALKLDARRVVLAHNHPSGSAEPSARDIEQTLILISQGAQLGVAIEDHLVVGKMSVVSMKDRGLF
ncbi:MAG: JAB domain-containing protein [Erythrobacter sp.]